MRKQIVKNLFTNYIATAIGVALGIFLIPFLIHKLGKDAFGLIILAESTIALFEVATVSVRIALARYAAFSYAQGRTEEFTGYLGTGRAILFVSSAFVLLGGLTVSLFFPSIFRVPPGLAMDSRFLFFFVTLAFSASIPNIVFWSVLYARQRFDWINSSLSFGLIARAIGLFFLYSVLPARFISLTTYGIVYLAMTLTQNGIIYFGQRKVMPEVHIRVRDFRRQKVKEIISFSFHTAMGRVSSLLSNDALNVIINLFWGAIANTVYSIGCKFPLVINRLFTEATWTLTPTFTELAARDEKEKMKTLFFVYTKFMTILIVPPVLFLVLMARPIVHLWVGPGFEEAADLLPVLAFPLVAVIPFAISGCLFNAYGKVKLPSRVSLAAALLNVGLGILFGKTFSQGLMGIAVASAAASIFCYGIFSPLYACRIAGISVREYWVRSFFVPCSWSLCVTGGCFFFLRATGLAGHLVFGLMMALALAVLGLSYAGSYFFVLNGSERARTNETLSEAVTGFFSSFKKNTEVRPNL